MKLILKHSSILGLIIMLFAGCQKNESIDQTLQPRNSEVGFTFIADNSDPNLIKFTNNNNGEGSVYQWSWGDGTYSTGNILSHKYPGLGSYKTVLTVTNAAGIKSIEKNVLIAGIDFSITTNDETEPLKISITSKNAGCSDVKFEWGDNTQTTTENPSNKTFANAGLYTVKMSGKLISTGVITSKELKVLVASQVQLTGSSSRTWIYHRTEGLKFFNDFSSQKDCELATDFTFSTDRNYQCDNKGSEIRFPNCTPQPPRGTTQFTLSRVNLTELKLNVGANTFFGDPVTGPDYFLTNLTDDMIECHKVNFGFTNEVKYKMIRK